MTFENPLLTTGAALLLGLSVAIPRAAPDGLFAPSKPSEAVTLRSSGAKCTTTSAGDRFDSLVDPADGSLSPFTVPDGQVLVITDATFDFNGNPGSYAVTFNAVTSTAPFGVIPIANAPFNIAPFHGGVTVHVGQAVIKPGMELCFRASDPVALGPSLANAVRGFLTEYK